MPSYTYESLARTGDSRLDRSTVTSGCLRVGTSAKSESPRRDPLQARVYRLFRPAQLALNLAAPMEGACAPLDQRHLLSLVASAAAHQVATVDADARIVTLSSVGAQDAELRILLAERRRLLQVDEVFQPGRLVLRIVRFQLEVVAMPAAEVAVYGVARRVTENGVAVTAYTVRIAHQHSRCAVETVLQVVANHAKIRQSHPASLHRARA